MGLNRAVLPTAPGHYLSKDGNYVWQLLSDGRWVLEGAYDDPEASDLTIWPTTRLVPAHELYEAEAKLARIAALCNVWDSTDDAGSSILREGVRAILGEGVT